jgi:hypothetical protein
MLAKVFRDNPISKSESLLIDWLDLMIAYSLVTYDISYS